MEEYPESNLKLRREHRKYFRFPVEGEAVLFLREPGERLHCRITDLGIEGCRLHREEEMPVRAGMEVEVYFRLAGINFRFAGSLQWSDRNHMVGVQFRQVGEVRAAELANLLGGLREELDARALEAEVAAEAARVAESAQAGNVQAAQTAQAVDLEKTAAEDGKEDGKKERRQHERHAVEGRARIRFLSVHSQVVGKILDVSLGGCRIRAEGEIPVGAFRRVEVEFMVHGTPLLLAGATQALHDRFTVGIRFVDVTERKREQLRELIEEIEHGIAV